MSPDCACGAQRGVWGVPGAGLGSLLGGGPGCRGHLKTKGSSQSWVQGKNQERIFCVLGPCGCQALFAASKQNIGVPSTAQSNGKHS